MKENRGKNILQRLLEGLITVALVLVFFVILIAVFNSVFPEGSGLQFIFDTGREDGSRTGRDGNDLRVTSGDGTNLLAGDDLWAATLVQTYNSVKSKKADDIAWHRARRGMRLQNLDAIQTLENSAAAIRFDDKNYIDLGENSLIVIRRMERDLLFREKRSFMVVVDGELRGRISGDAESDVYLEVETPNAVARLKSNPEDRNGIEFKIDVLEDSRSAVTVYSGEAEVEAQGETVLLGRNQLTRIEGDLVPSVPVTLPDPTPLLEPAHRTSFPYRSLPPRVRLRWEEQAGVARYHFVLARDENFTDILVDRKQRNNEFIHGNLREGDYYWKVSSIGTAGEGPFSETRRFVLRQDQVPPDLDVLFPPELVERAQVDITGKSEPNANIYISGELITARPDGSFRHNLKIERGINILVVEAIDPAGNVSYRSQMINGKY